MKNVFFLFLLARLAVSVTWTQTFPLNTPTARSEPSCVNINSTLYMHGGYVGTVDGNTYRKDIASSEWKLVSSSGPQVADAMKWLYEDRYIYLFGGYTAAGRSNEISDVYRYDTELEVWEHVKGTKELFSDGNYVDLGVFSEKSAPRSRMEGFYWEFEGIFYVFGGYSIRAGPIHSYLSDLWAFDPISVQWKYTAGSQATNSHGTATYPSARYSGASWVVGDNAYLFGGIGYTITGAWQALNDMWKYDMKKNTWTAQNVAGDVPLGRYAFGSWVRGDSVYIFGGRDASGTYLKDFWEFSVASSKWKLLDTGAAIPFRAAGCYFTDAAETLYMSHGSDSFLRSTSFGTCVDQDEFPCRCSPGHFGRNCEECDCVHGSCENSLISSGECICEKGWEGENCACQSAGEVEVSAVFPERNAEISVEITEFVIEFGSKVFLIDSSVFLEVIPLSSDAESVRIPVSEELFDSSHQKLTFSIAANSLTHNTSYNVKFSSNAFTTDKLCPVPYELDLKWTFSTESLSTEPPLPTETTEAPCEVTCGHNGNCESGTCICDPGFTGRTCDCIKSRSLTPHHYLPFSNSIIAPGTSEFLVHFTEEIFPTEDDSFIIIRTDDRVYKVIQSLHLDDTNHYLTFNASFPAITSGPQVYSLTHHGSYTDDPTCELGYPLALQWEVIVECNATCQSANNPNLTAGNTHNSLTVFKYGMIALAVLLVIYVIADRVSKYMSPGSQPSYLVTSLLGLFDFISDVNFLVMLGKDLSNDRIEHLFICGVLLLLLTMLLNMVNLTRVVRTEFKEAAVHQHFVDNRSAWITSFTLSVFNINSFLLIRSGVFDIEALKCPMELATVDRVIKFGWVGLLFEDFPQIIIQLLVHQITGEWTSVQVFAFTFSFMSLMTGSVRVILSTLSENSLKKQYLYAESQL